jgi:hypothetical protein
MPNVIEMPPNVWGPIFWNTLHIITLGYPSQPDEATQQAAKNFFFSLIYLLPCDICKQHYKKHIEEFPPDVSSQKALVQYAFTLHNRVNKDLGKRDITYSEFIEHIQSLSESKSFLSEKNMLTLLSIISISGLAYYFYKKMK